LVLSRITGASIGNSSKSLSDRWVIVPWGIPLSLILVVRVIPGVGLVKSGMQNSTIPITITSIRRIIPIFFFSENTISWVTLFVNIHFFMCEICVTMCTRGGFTLS
jgi:hypothetical protein